MMHRLFLPIMLLGIYILTTGCKNESPIITRKVNDGKIPVTLELLSKETIKEPFYYQVFLLLRMSGIYLLNWAEL